MSGQRRAAGAHDALDAAWGVLTAGDTDSPRCPLEVTGTTGHLRSHFPVEEVALACTGTALLAAAALHQQRGGSAPTVSLDRGHLAAAVRSEAYFRRAGQPAGASFAPLSRFWAAADGWVRTHANYPWHLAALRRALGCDAGAAADALTDAMAARPAGEIEDRVFAAGGVAAAVRTLDEWRAHPQGQAVTEEPLIAHRVVGQAAPRRRPLASLPASGVRVLDLTRVIAGPVCTRFLGALGADVLRIDPPGHLDMAPSAAADTLLAKRSAFLDLGSPEGLGVLHRLLERADVVVHGYRPGSLDRFGLGAPDLGGRHPGLVVVHLDAWGHHGPWAHRRGFDSIVQAACGIAATESADGTAPGALPCQLLDHGTGYLAAAAALDGLRRQAAGGGTHVRSLSLAGTAAWLTGLPRQALSASHSEAGSSGRPPWLVEIAGPSETVTAVAPPGRFDDRLLTWPERVAGYGDSLATWSAG